MTERYDYESLKQLAAKLNRPVGTLIVQDPGADPFYADLPMRRMRAEWFKQVWNQFHIEAGAHLRRIHYLLASQSPRVELPREVNGTWDYINTVNCWVFLGDAATDARYLGLIPITHISDQRNARTIVNYVAEQRDASLSVENGVGEEDSAFGWSFESLMPSRLYTPAFPKLPALNIEAPSIPQPYCLEVWVEKSTMDDVLAPLCRRYGANYTTGTGDISLTRCHDLIERAREHGKPVRVLTITDFDPGGANMPVSLARKLEFLIQDMAPDLDDVQVRPVALTRTQVRKYKLPTIPIRESNRQAAEFERRQDVTGATELDALEALRPGELRKIVEKEIRRYNDADLDESIRDAVRNAQQQVDEISAAVRAEQAPKIERLRSEYRALVEEMAQMAAAEVDRLREAFEVRFRERFDDLAGRVKASIRGIMTSLDDEAPDPDDFDWPEPDFGDEDPDPLFDSTRGYVKQADRYKEHQQKPTTRRCRNGGQR